MVKKPRFIACSSPGSIHATERVVVLDIMTRPKVECPEIIAR